MVRGASQSIGTPLFRFCGIQKRVNRFLALAAGIVGCLASNFMGQSDRKGFPVARARPANFVSKRIMLRVMVLPAMAVAVTVLAACGGIADTLVPATAAPTETPAATPRPTVTLAPRQLQALLEGDGSDVLGPYEMGRGVIIAFVRYEGGGPFSMTFVDEEQGVVRSVKSTPGPYVGERVHSVFIGNEGGLAPGDYTVDVEATGPWRIRLFQERASRGQPPRLPWRGVEMAAEVGCSLKMASTR